MSTRIYNSCIKNTVSVYCHLIHADLSLLVCLFSVLPVKINLKKYDNTVLTMFIIREEFGSNYLLKPLKNICQNDHTHDKSFNI